MEISESYFFYSLGKKIKELRIKSELTLETFSALTNIAKDDLMEMESGNLSISIEDLIIISNALNLKPSSLLQQFDTND